MKKIQELNPNTRIYWNNTYINRDGYIQITKGVGGNSKRLETALSYIKDTDKVLDIGCGIGMFTKMVKEKYPKCDVWGTDISDETIKTNQEEGLDIKYSAQYIGSQDLPNDYFNVVFSGEVLEHLDKPEDLVKDAYSALKQGGKFVLTTPNNNLIESTEHVWLFSKDDVKKLMEDNGFKNIEFVNLPDIEHLYVIFAIGTK